MMMNQAHRGARIEAQALSKCFEKGGRRIDVLREVDVLIEPGECVAVVGPSGAGKSTFLHLLGLLDDPTSGSLALNGNDVGSLSQNQRAEFRNSDIGFVFQAHHLLPEHTALGNVMVPPLLAGASRSVASDRAEILLNAVGLKDRILHKPGELSGGEQQRVALARALVMGPGLVLADEPTGNLDSQTALSVFELLLSLNAQFRSTLVVVTHSASLARRFSRNLRLEHGVFSEIVQ